MLVSMLVSGRGPITPFLIPSLYYLFPLLAKSPVKNHLSPSSHALLTVDRLDALCKVLGVQKREGLALWELQAETDERREDSRTG